MQCIYYSLARAAVLQSGDGGGCGQRPMDWPIGDWPRHARVQVIAQLTEPLRCRCQQTQQPTRHTRPGRARFGGMCVGGRRPWPIGQGAQACRTAEGEARRRGEGLLRPPQALAGGSLKGENGRKEAYWLLALNGLPTASACIPMHSARALPPPLPVVRARHACVYLELSACWLAGMHRCSAACGVLMPGVLQVSGTCPTQGGANNAFLLAQKPV
jgi:hypothetical protein